MAGNLQTVNVRQRDRKRDKENGYSSRSVRRLSYGGSISSSHVLTRTCLIISSSGRASWSNVMKFKYPDVTFTRKLFHSILAEALTMPVTTAVFTRLMFCTNFCFPGSWYRRPRNKNCRVEWTTHCLVFSYNAAFRKHRKLCF